MAKKGHGWVGVIGGLPDTPWDLTRDLNFSLDVARVNYLVNWFNKLGVEVSVLLYPPQNTDITDPLEDPDVVAYIANAHGVWEWAYVRDESNKIYASEIATALQNRGPMKFSFLIHSHGMDEIGAGTWTEALSQGQATGAVVVGTQKGMSAGKWILWQLFWAGPYFVRVSQDMPFKRAFDLTNFWSGYYFNANMRFHGDESMSRKDLQ